MLNQDEPIEIFSISPNKRNYSFRNYGEFEIIESIGEGYFSEVFKAKPKESNISKSSKSFNYIIKICQKNSLIKNNENPNSLKRILFNEIREIHLLKRIQNIGNPNLIQMYDWDIDRKTGEVRILSEFMPYDLRNYFSKEENYKNLDENLLRKITFQILNGLCSLHKNRIIHFDIKPENILFDPRDNKVKITDFGLSQYVNYDLDVNNLSNGGTYPYMPPESLMETKKYSFSYDIWSLGVILMELSCKINPFKGLDSKMLCKNMMRIYETKSLFISYEYCKYNKYSNLEKKRIVNYIQTNQKINFKNGDFYDLVSRMLCINPLYRITAEDALKHPWFVNYSN